MIKHSFILFVLCFFSLLGMSQKAVHFSELEMQADGKFYQINTIPPFTGTAYEIHPPQNEKQKNKQKQDPVGFMRSAQKRESVTFKDGKPNGIARGWDEFGQKIYEANLVNGLQQGLEKQWYPTGKLKSEVPFENGKPNGLAIQYWEGGQKKSEGQYLNGFEEGVHMWWFENGSKDQQVPYEEGLVNGTVYNWFQDGTLKLESNYQENKQHGLTSEYFNNQQKKAEGSYINGEEQGIFYAWNRKGKLLDEKHYEAGTLTRSKDFRNAGIRTPDGFEQVFNQLGINYQVSVHGDEVQTVNSWNIAFITDGKYLQMLAVEGKALGMDLGDPQGYLEALKAREVKNAEADIKVKLEVESKTGKNKDQLDWLFWTFQNPEPGKGNRRVDQEMYLALYLGDEILLLSSVVTNQDRPEAIERFLIDQADQVQLFEAPIDINAIREAAIQRKQD